MAITAQPTAVGTPGYRQTLPCREESVGLAREFIVTALHAWDLPEPVADAALIVSELTTNAVRHSGSRSFAVCVTQIVQPEGLYVRISVKDGSQALPARQQPDASDEHGRGLLLVDALSERWGTDPLPTGKCVWADLRLPRNGRTTNAKPPTALPHSAQRPRCPETARIGPYAPYAQQLLSPEDREADLFSRRFRCELEHDAKSPAPHYAYVGEASPSLSGTARPHEIWLVWHPDFVYIAALTACLETPPHDAGTHCLLPAGHRLAHDWNLTPERHTAPEGAG